VNERIEKLAVQARAETYAHFDDETFDWDVWHTVFQHKFAELIIAECIDVFSKDLPDTTSPDYQLGSLPEVVNRIANVAEHFGVEE
jgi:hypothetical protein